MVGGIRHSYGLGLDLHPNLANIGHLKANKYSHVIKISIFKLWSTRLTKVDEWVRQQ